jgi:eukaryotic-like serine/threonine-protein kinase
MAQVYLGTMIGAEGFERRVAIKRILPAISADIRIVRMFASEARLATFLHHQNIVQVIDVGRAGEDLYIVMELVNGWDLGRLLDRAAKLKRPFPPHLAAHVGQEVMLALCHAYGHTQNGKQVIAAHRDVSPSNVMVSKEGEVKVADFGIARLEAPANATEPGTFKGKMAYTSPEVLMGEPATAASDQFALGMVLYEMLASHHPFGVHDEALVYARAIPLESPAPLVQAPLPLRAIVDRMMMKRPNERFPTPEACGRALGDFLSRSGKAANAMELANFVRTLGLPRPPLEASDITTPGNPGILDLQPLTTPSSGVASSASASDSALFRAMGPQMTPDGRLVAPSGVVSVRRPAPTGDASSGIREIALESTGDEKPGPLELDLAERFVPQTVPVDPQPSEPPPRRRVPGIVIFLIIIGLLAAGGFLAWPKLRGELPSILSAVPLISQPKHPIALVVTFDSEPSGARVIVAGQDLGVTPLSIDNDYPEAAIDVRMEKTGYRPWKGTFEGGKPQRVTAELKR